MGKIYPGSHPDVDRKLLALDLLNIALMLLFVFTAAWLMCRISLRRSLTLGEFALFFTHPWKLLPCGIQIFMAYLPLTVSWLWGIRLITSSEILRYGPGTAIGRVFNILSLILLLLPILLALICWPFDFGSGISFNFKAFGEGLLFSLLYFVAATWALLA